MRKTSLLVLGVFTVGLLSGVGLTTIHAAIRGSAVFTDVPSTHYADTAIGEMYQLGIIKGKSSTTFGPNEYITRADTAILLKRLRDELKGIGSSVSSSRSSSSSSSSSSSESSSSSSSSYNPGGVVRFGAIEFTVEKNVATGKATILVVRTGGNQGAGTVQYVFGSGGTAVAGQDYDPVSGTLTFANKETSKQVNVTIRNNTSSSGDKTVKLKLMNPTGAFTLSTPNDIFLIIRDPNSSSSSSNSSSSSSSAAAGGTVGFSALSYGVMEGSALTVTVQRTGTTTAAVNVNYATSDGTADSSDYSGVSGTLTFASGETTKTFSVSTINNTSVDGNRIFTMTLSAPTGGAVLGTASVVTTINDDEISTSGSGSVKFSASTFDVTESQGKAKIIVNRVGSLIPASVTFATANGSAISPNDYTSTTGTLSFTAGETSKFFEVPVISDGQSESQETVSLSLSSPVGAALLEPYIATLRISD